MERENEVKRGAITWGDNEATKPDTRCPAGRDHEDDFLQDRFRERDRPAAWRHAAERGLVESSASASRQGSSPTDQDEPDTNSPRHIRAKSACMIWDAKADELLVSLWDEGCSLAYVADGMKQAGYTVSRNSVAGRKHRLTKAKFRRTDKVPIKALPL